MSKTHTTDAKLQRAIAILAFWLVGTAMLTGAQKGSKSDPGAQVNFTSVYTDMQRDCKTPAAPELIARGSDPPSFCKGYGGYRISIGYSAFAAYLSADRIKNSEDSINLGADYGGYGQRGEKVEWRMANGKPFAVIIRFGKYRARDDGGDSFADELRIGSALVIKGLKGWEQIDFEVNGATPNANQKARDLADQNFSKK